MRTLFRVAVALVCAFVLSTAAPIAQEKPAPVSAAAPLNLNTATLEQLDALPGIGRSTAQRILEHREKNGAFKKIEELMNVKGIGEKAFLKIKPLITVSAKPGKTAGQQH